MKDLNVKKIIESYNCLIKNYKSLLNKIDSIETDNQSPILNHNLLENIQGGNNGEYYHLSLALYNFILDLPNKLNDINNNINSLSISSSELNTIKSNINDTRTLVNSFINQLNNKVDKIEGKNLSTNDFTNVYKDLLDNLSNLDISSKLDSGGYDGTAKDLKDLIDTKVNKDGNKVLSDVNFSFDDKTLLDNLPFYKNELDTKLGDKLDKGNYTGNAQDLKNYITSVDNKLIESISITGDVNKTLTILLKDGNTIQTTFIDVDTLPSPDIMLNSLDFDKDSGILKGVRSDSTQLTTSLNGRWSLLDHTHTWDSITDKPDLTIDENSLTLTQNYDLLSVSSTDKQKKFNEKVTWMLEQLMPLPTYIQPTVSISNLPSIGEVGSTVSVNLTTTYNKNDGGNITNIEMLKNNISVGNSTTNSHTYTESLVLTTSNVEYKGKATYQQGQIKNNSLNIPDGRGRIQAGSKLSESKIIKGVYPVFYGTILPNQTIDNVLLTNLSKSIIESTGTVSIKFTNIVGKRLVILIPVLSTIKRSWFVSELNKGSIGNAGDLFSNPIEKQYTSVDNYWNNIGYRIYISSPTNLNATIQLRNN